VEAIDGLVRRRAVEKPLHDFPSHPVWERLRGLGTRLWLDTGSLEEAARRWTREFSALTTNNDLLNRQVQTGRYDVLIREVDALLDRFDLSPRERMLEITFVLNARHGLRLVDRFDARVSVEEHTDLAESVQEALHYARRFHRVHPERFVVKLPLTPAGLLATRRAAREGIPVNHTLGFSARQNYVVTRFARPAFVNVFLGRLNSFVADNGLGQGERVGEKAVLASQRVVRRLRGKAIATRQIAASFRDAAQVPRLGGVDVMTLPPAVAGEVASGGVDASILEDRTDTEYSLSLKPGCDPGTTGLKTLWDLDEGLREAVDTLEERAPLEGPGVLVDVFHRHGLGDLFPRWSRQDVQSSAEEGKIPSLERWGARLADGSIGLDALMNLAGLNRFRAAQKAMDDRVRGVLSGSVRPEGESGPGV